MGDSSMTVNEVLKHVREYILCTDVDLDQAQRPNWFYKPFTPEELAVHPDRERILATAEAIAEEMIEAAVRDAKSAIEIDDDLPV